MHNLTRSGQSKQPEGRKVHPQLLKSKRCRCTNKVQSGRIRPDRMARIKKSASATAGSKECGCQISQILESAREQRQEKCIRSCQKAKMRMHQSGESGQIRRERKVRIPKSASATAKKQGCGCTFKLAPGRQRNMECKNGILQ